MSDPWNKAPSEQNFSRAGAPITPSNSDMATISNGLFVVDGGDVTFIPVDSDDGDAITITDAPVELVIPYFVRRLTTATTATVASLLPS